MEPVVGAIDGAALLAQLRIIGLAALLAGLLGLEREIKGKPAGLRTHILVGVGAALLVLLGDVYVARFESEFGGGMVRADPIRLIQAVVVGISLVAILLPLLGRLELWLGSKQARREQTDPGGSARSRPR